MQDVVTRGHRSSEQDRLGNGLLVDRFIRGVIRRNPGETEFHQAVREVLETVAPFVVGHPQYRTANILERITEPDRVVSFKVTWEDDLGNIHVNRGYRVQFNNAIGPYKGGLRFHPSVNQSILKFLAFEQIFKNSLTGLPMGGAKGGANFDPKGKSDREVMRFCQAFMTELARHIGENVDVPAGDIGVGAREISFLFGQYKRLQNRWAGVLTGKGLEYGGSLIRKEATGYGTVYFLRHMLAARGEDIEGKRCLVSGSGNVALYALEKLIQLGARVITVSDSGGFILDPDGIDEEKLDWLKDLKEMRRGRVQEYAEHFGCDYYPETKPWGVPADLAIPCATQNEINAEDARRMVDNGVSAVAEGANMPTELPAVHILLQNRVLLGIGKAANAGGVAVSGLEQSQNSQRLSWSREEVDARLQGIMKNIHTKCVEFGQEDGYINYPKGANIAGFIKVADAMLRYGIV